MRLTRRQLRTELSASGWTHPSIIDLMDNNTQPYRGEKLSAPQIQAMAFLRGTGETRKNGSLKSKFVGSRVAYITLRALRRKGLIDHFIAGHWYLTSAGEKWRSI